MFSVRLAGKDPDGGRRYLVQRLELGGVSIHVLWSVNGTETRLARRQPSTGDRLKCDTSAGIENKGPWLPVQRQRAASFTVRCVSDRRRERIALDAEI